MTTKTEPRDWAHTLGASLVARRRAELEVLKTDLQETARVQAIIEKGLPAWFTTLHAELVRVAGAFSAASGLRVIVGESGPRGLGVRASDEAAVSLVREDAAIRVERRTLGRGEMSYLDPTVRPGSEAIEPTPAEAARAILEPWFKTLTTLVATEERA